MNRNNSAGIPKMPHSGHNQHLCLLVNFGYHEKKAKEYHGLVSGGKYYCGKCGRVAAKARNLCKPIKLDN